MNHLNNITMNLISKSTCFFVLILLFSVGCMNVKKNQEIIEVKGEEAPMINIVTNQMDFVVQDTISSGWHTFNYINKSNETHFFLIDKYPQGYSIHDTEKEIGPVFQKGMDLINAGKPEEAFEVFKTLPEWFSKIVFVGGSGLVSPKTSALTTLKLEPGYYILECYVKMPNGSFHSSMGMAKALVVTNERSENKPPDATLSIKLGSKEGIRFVDTVSSGKQIFSVNFLDQITHENFVGHDINLVKVEEDADLSELELWLNWADPKGLITPAPAGFKFLGGVNDMPGGSIGYFEASLDPGNYILISEVPNAISKKLYKSFIILN